MSAEDGRWFRAGVYSLWAYDRIEEEASEPIFFVLYEWEIAALRGLHLAGVFGELSELDKPKAEWNTDYQTLIGEVMEPQQMDSLQLATLIDSGHLHRIGTMPQIERLGKYITPPAACVR